MRSYKLSQQIVLEEVEKKNEIKRMNWYMKNEIETNPDGPKSSAASQRPAHVARLLGEIREVRAEIDEIKSKLEDYRREIQGKKYDRYDVNQLPPGLETEVSYMYPVPQDVRDQLYTGTNSNNDGRLCYLKTRNKLMPEEKFWFSPTQNLEYGWNIRNLVTGRSPKHGKKQVLKNDVYSVHGITLYEKHPTHRLPNSSNLLKKLEGIRK